MRTGRRGFLGAVAALAGAAVIAPKVEAAAVGDGSVTADPYTTPIVDFHAKNPAPAILTTTPREIVLKDNARIDGALLLTSGRVVIDGKDIAVTNCTIQCSDLSMTPNAERVILNGNVILPAAGAADARAEGYADGYTQATQRAESRVALGLSVKPYESQYFDSATKHWYSWDGSKWCDITESGG